MLVTRQCDTGRNTWSSRKFEDVFHNAASPRMSTFEGLSSQQDWREQYTSFTLPGENGLLSPSPSYEQAASPEANQDQIQQHTSGRPPLGHRHSMVSTREDAHPVLLMERPSSAPEDCGNQVDESGREESLNSTELPTIVLDSVGSNRLRSISSASQQHSMLSNSNEGGDMHGDIKDEDDEEELDDDEMLDTEEGGVPQTAAERRAERRKMKRFRLTHQQTRFLMSEFAKQAHPDASHRERLSKEIPGLSPRQVQVWFQNRRAKIKRLTQDDRERMMKMRAVPDDFDNVQALHSPYGAVHGIGNPMHSPIDFVPSYSEHMMRPLMVDTMRRSDNDEQHMSPTGLTPGFSHVGFNGNGQAMGSPDILSPLSINSNDRFYGSHLNSPMSAGPRSSSFDRQSTYQGLPHSRQHVRPLQPLQLRETLSRTRSESLQSPLRSSMSWKGETLDYGSYQNGHPSPHLTGRQQSTYQPEQNGNTSSAQQYDGNSYPTTTVHSPPHMSYATSHGPSLSLQQSSPSAMSRLRASSSAFPPSLDLRNQYRTLPSQSNSIATPRSGTFSNAFSGGYASAPLAAPVDFSLPRTPGEPSSQNRDFNIPQMSAPMAPPMDFTNAYNGSRAQQQQQQHQHQSEQREFAAQQSHSSTEQQRSPRQQQLPRSNDDTNFIRPPEFESAAGQKRKRSFTIPGQFDNA